MAGRRCPNPFAFRQMSVTIITALVYLAIVIPLIVIQETVPKAPADPVLYHGLNTTEAWLDLATLTNGYHPYNSRRNDEVRNWLLIRIEEILRANGIEFATASQVPSRSDRILSNIDSPEARNLSNGKLRTRTSSPAVTIFNDLQSNLSYSNAGSIGTAGQGRLPGTSVYFEGTNIMVYIRGTEDEEGEWWHDEYSYPMQSHGQGGVLVNAHYDSVSTGFGATDDGVGVVTVLQLIKFFTTAGKQPVKGIVAMLNNGEEDFLNGANAYTQHPISDFAFTFLNLEGAGAGGRATLFRSTDAEVTKAYAESPHPFGSVVGSDGFKQGFVRSGTDYSVFEGILGLRGLDVAFWYPRARYHTDQDDAKHTSVDSLWHMLSSSVATMQALTSDTSDTFNGPRGDGAKGKVKNGNPSDGVWFDLFGKGFAIFGLRGLFAWSLSLLIASPVILIVCSYILIRQGKFYFFSSKTHAGPGDTDDQISLYGWRGFFRFPVAIFVSSGLTIGSALLVRKTNPLIVYSSHYAVWAMMLSLQFTSYWFIMRGADFVRPSALHRGYVFLWMFVLGWAVLVAATVFEDRFRIASGYLFVFFESAIFLGTLISLCESFVLPSKSAYGKYKQNQRENQTQTEALPESDVLISHRGGLDDDEEPTEETPLFGGIDGAGGRRVTTFANYARRSLGGREEAKDEFDASHTPYGNEQGWSGKLPSWTWLFQFLIICPFMLIILGQVAMFLIEATAQTGSDGNSLMFPFLLIALFSILLMLPLAPFSHRITHHIPTFIFLVFIGTFLYSILAFPFSPNNRYKAYFQQTVDLETGQNRVSISGLEEYVRPIIASLPSASGQAIECTSGRYRSELKSCSFEGLPPKVVDNTPAGAPPEKGYADWLSFNATRPRNQNYARFTILGRNTRACTLRFNRAIKDYHVEGSGSDERFDRVPEQGSDQIRLWHREWDQPWIVDVEWGVSDGKAPGDEGMEGRVVCLWSDDNVDGVIPALDEVRRFAPAWSAVTKWSDGLVEGSKGFIV